MRYITYIIPAIFLLFTVNAAIAKKAPQAENNNLSKLAKPKWPSDSVRTIHIYGMNQLKFAVKNAKQKGIVTGKKIGREKLPQLKEIIAKPGEKIKIRFTSDSKSMSHNFVLLKQTANPTKFARAAMQAKSNGYIPKSNENEIVAHTPLTGPGKTTQITFTVPQKKGNYAFLCSFPGHYFSGMKGILKVK
jgi:uncharacterized cupredoxin-like copper-binding protein